MAETWQAIADAATQRFAAACDPHIADWLSEEQGLGFHLSVSVLAADLSDKWPAAVDALAAAVCERGARRTFDRLPQSQGVLFSAGSLPRLVVQYHMPTVSEDGDLVPEFLEARFDVVGVSYPEPQRVTR